MSDFELIKKLVTPAMAAQMYGVKETQEHKCLCVFHNEKHPSLKLYNDHVHCFGCNKTGDTTAFVAAMFGITQGDACEKIMHDFGISHEEPKVKYVSGNDFLIGQTKKSLENHIDALTVYINKYNKNYMLLVRAGAPWPDKMINAMKNRDKAECALDILENMQYPEAIQYCTGFVKKMPLAYLDFLSEEVKNTSIVPIVLKGQAHKKLTLKKKML